MKSRDAKTPKKPKKPYHRPRLVMYGDLRTLTLAIGMRGPQDGGPMMIMVKS
jgi:hypothetical protein